MTKRRQQKEVVNLMAKIRCGSRQVSQGWPSGRFETYAEDVEAYQEDAQVYRIGMILGVVLLVIASMLASAAFGFTLDDTELKGDLRLRYQYEKKQDQSKATEITRHRERMRFRFGFETQVRDGVKVGMTLASGSDDPRSTNQSFEDVFSTKGIHLDQAYVMFMLWQGLQVVAGKFGKAFHCDDGLLWDSDITLEGQAIKLTFPLAQESALFLNGGMFLLDEIKNKGTDPHMFVAQPGLRAALGNGLSLHVSLAYYAFNHAQGNPDWGDIVSTNTTVAEVDTLVDACVPCDTTYVEHLRLHYDYDSINPAVAVTYSWTSSEAEYALKMIGDYIYNTDSEGTGYLLGVKCGHSKVKKAGSWQIYYNWRRLERDAFLDTFPDSDFRGGATNVTGYEAVVSYALAKNLVAGLDYYRTKRVDGDEDPEDLLQVDLQVKF
jgi:hypothetical protein